jgi:hypothetical protein
MKIYKEERIVGMYRGGEIVCAHCMSDEDWMSLTKDNILIQRQVDKGEGLYRCDSCGAQITACPTPRGLKRAGGLL